MDESPRDLNVWSDLISYPVTRINDELSVSEPDEILEKRRNRDIEESCQMTKQLSIQMVESLKDQVQLSSIFATIIKALTISSKALSVTGNTDPLNQTVETFYAKAQEMEAVNAQVIAEMLKFYASQGQDGRLYEVFEESSGVIIVRNRVFFEYNCDDHFGCKSCGLSHSGCV